MVTVVPRFRLLLWLLVAQVVLTLAVGAVLGAYVSGLSRADDRISQQQQASQCWDRVLVVALHDRLTPAQRAVLIVQANRCAALTR